MQQDMESAHIDIQRDLEERVTYGMLLEAAIQGKNMEVLLRLLQDDRANLHRVMWECRGKDNPLHVGALDHSTILHLLSARGNYQVIKLLLKNAGVNVNAENVDGFTPLEVSLLHTNNPWDDCRIQLLLTEAGAKTHRMQTESLLAGLRRNIEMPGKDERKTEEKKSGEEDEASQTMKVLARPPQHILCYMTIRATLLLAMESEPPETAESVKQVSNKVRHVMCGNLYIINNQPKTNDEI
ncbi:hypothetical protein AAC387_Pa07g0429 [Persea americana]